MIGRRVYPDLADHGAMKFAEGDYGKNIYGRWLGRPPGGRIGELGDVEEHEDGTITVAPSIEGPGFHGYLERGVWRTV